VVDRQVRLLVRVFFDGV